MFLTEDKEHSGSEDTLGGRIVYAREAQDLTTSQLARRMGVKTETLQEWETDRAEPRSNRLLTLAGMLNVSPTWLLTGAGESPADALTATEMMHIRESVERMREQVLAVADELEQLRKRLDSYESYQA
jgi:transcriptional regulator with XRE-family HTH domain